MPPAGAFEHVLAECGYGGGDAAIGAHGPAHRGGGLGVLGGLRDGVVCNSSAALLLLRDVICGMGGLGALLSAGVSGALLGVALCAVRGGRPELPLLVCCALMHCAVNVVWCMMIK